MAAALLGVLATACGSGAGSTAATTTTVPADVAAVVVGPFTSAGGTPAQAGLLLAAGCAVLAPADRNRDSASLNDYVTDLFDGGPGGHDVRRDRGDVDVALEQGCAQHGDDVDAFVASVAGALALTPADAQDAIDGACAGYVQRLRTNAGDGYAPKPLDERVLALLGVAGIDEARAKALIEAYCGPV